MSERLVERMRCYGETIFAEMSALAVELGAINLGQGFPDTDGPAGMLEAATRAIRTGANQYPPGPGVPQLREAVARQRLERYGVQYDPAGEVFITVGATEAIAASILALCEAGDEVVVFEPWYDSYPPAVSLAGASRRNVRLRPDGPGGRFTFDPDELRAAFSTRTRAVIVNSPHNPTGTVFTREEMESIAALCREFDVIAITDEVYEYLTYDGIEHISLASLPEMRERTIAISSAGKSFSATGWKTGWACAPAELISAIQTVKQFTTYATNGVFQLAVAHALTEELPWLQKLRADLQSKRDRLRDGLVTAGFEVYQCGGTYFLQVDVRSVGVADGTAFARELPKRAGIVAIPGAAFYDDKEAGRPFIRFAFCKRDEVIDEAVSRLHAL